MVECRKGSNLYFGCGSPRHRFKECPIQNIREVYNKNGGQKNGHGNNKGHNNKQSRASNMSQLESAQAQVFSLPTPQQGRDSLVVRGTICFFNSFARVFFDSGASYSFMYARFPSTLGLHIDIIYSPLHVATLIGGTTPLRGMCRACEFIVADMVFPFDLIILDMTIVYVILSMDRLSSNRTFIDHS